MRRVVWPCPHNVVAVVLVVVAAVAVVVVDRNGNQYSMLHGHTKDDGQERD